MKRPRLAYLYSRFPYFSQTFCDTEMLGLEARGWDLVAASCYPPEHSFRHERLDNLAAPLHYPPPAEILKILSARAKRDGRWPERQVARHEMAYGGNFQSDIRARNAFWLARRLQAEGVEHIHVHFANRATHTALFIQELTGIPFSFTAHAQDFMVDLGSRDLLGEMVAKARFVVAVSDFTTRMLQEWFPDHAGKIHRVYNGLDTSEFTVPTQRRKGWPMRVFSVGRLIEFKGFHHLLEATAIAQKNGATLELRIAGDGPWEQKLREQARRLGLVQQGVVTFLGRLSQARIRAELQQAQLFALACITDEKGASDILPTVITEAMLSGLPVVSTRLAGVPEMVVDGQTGILVEPGDIKALASALERMSATPSRLIKNGDAGRERALQLFDRNHTLAQLETLFVSHHRPEDATGQPAQPGLEILLEEVPAPGSRRATELQALAEGLPAARLTCAELGRRVDSDGLESLGPLTERLDFLPDGVVLEMEWTRAGFHRAELETLRSRLGSKVEGESFFRACRRALWSARQIHRRYPQAEARRLIHLHSQRSDTLLWTWLTSLLAGVPFTACVEHRPQLPYPLIREIARDAVSLWAEEPGKAGEAAVGHATWPLHNPQPERKTLGPLRWKGETPEPQPAESADLVEALRKIPERLRSFRRQTRPQLRMIQQFSGDACSPRSTTVGPALAAASSASLAPDSAPSTDHSSDPAALDSPEPAAFPVPVPAEAAAFPAPNGTDSSDSSEAAAGFPPSPIHSADPVHAGKLPPQPGLAEVSDPSAAAVDTPPTADSTADFDFLIDSADLADRSDAADHSDAAETPDAAVPVGSGLVTDTADVADLTSTEPPILTPETANHSGPGAEAVAADSPPQPDGSVAEFAANFPADFQPHPETETPEPAASADLESWADGQPAPVATDWPEDGENSLLPSPSPNAWDEEFSANGAAEDADLPPSLPDRQHSPDHAAWDELASAAAGEHAPPDPQDPADEEFLPESADSWLTPPHPAEPWAEAHSTWGHGHDAGEEAWDPEPSSQELPAPESALEGHSGAEPDADAHQAADPDSSTTTPPAPSQFPANPWPQTDPSQPDGVAPPSPDHPDAPDQPNAPDPPPFPRNLPPEA